MTETKVAVRLKPNPKLNSIKEKMSIAYMHGLNSIVNYSFSEAGKDFDGLGIDLQIINKLVGEGRTVSSEANMINLQLKGVSVTSKSMISETDTEITYKLSKSLTPVATHYLVVVVLPEVESLESWREISEDALVLKARAYYLLIQSHQKAGNIKIPKVNVLNPISYVKLFDAAKIKGIA